MSKRSHKPRRGRAARVANPRRICAASAAHPRRIRAAPRQHRATREPPADPLQEGKSGRKLHFLWQKVASLPGNAYLCPRFQVLTASASANKSPGQGHTPMATITILEDQKQLSQELKRWRARSGLTQSQVAERFNCSRYSIIRCEQSKHVGWLMTYRIAARLLQELREEAENR